MCDLASDMMTLNARVQDDLARTAHPRQGWLTPRTGPDGMAALDVLIVGAGQSGVAAAFGLARARVDNVLLIDKAPRGLEGPWLTYARMPTLRSPKDFTGPDLDVPSLTYQSWHEATYGTAQWQALRLITRQDWAAYLLWVRDRVGVRVQNEAELIDIAPAGDLLAATVRRVSGRQGESETEVLYARKILLATGQDSTGTWWMPPEIASLPSHVRAHTAEDIDFAALRGRRVAVIGAGASALDNAAMALEHGARQVTVLCRRGEVQVVQPYRWLTFRGFMAHIGDLDDAWRWRFMAYILGLREGFPQDTYDRCSRHSAFRIVTGADLRGAEAVDDGVRLDTAAGRYDADFVICGTGIEMDYSARPELRRFAHNVATWADRYQPPANERHDRLARFPYLTGEFGFAEKAAGLTPWIGNIHLFTIASTMSFGPSGSSINAMTTIVPKLVSGITRGLFTADLADHWASLQAYNLPQAVLKS